MAERKVGDVLFRDTGYDSICKSKIVSISKTGRLTMQGGTVLNPDLSVRGVGYNRFYEQTPQLKERFRRQCASNRMRNLPVDEYTTDSLIEAFKVLRKGPVHVK